jgi:hypothetical protein
MNTAWGTILDQGSKGKTKKIRRKYATVASYSMFYRFLCNAMQRARENPKNTAQTRHSCTISPCVLADFAINHPAGLAESGIGGSAVAAS